MTPSHPRKKAGPLRLQTPAGWACLCVAPRAHRHRHRTVPASHRDSARWERKRCMVAGMVAAAARAERQAGGRSGAAHGTNEGTVGAAAAKAPYAPRTSPILASPPPRSLHRLCLRRRCNRRRLNGRLQYRAGNPTMAACCLSSPASRQGRAALAPRKISKKFLETNRRASDPSVRAVLPYAVENKRPSPALSSRVEASTATPSLCVRVRSVRPLLAGFFLRAAALRNAALRCSFAGGSRMDDQ
ncbi:uncharacterized protein PSFLO_06219 [Pseudozyma flocculosa]|uniref:Uncharacterized protein n=1 Tax=Pseudozyma flocculosa TaxID=84751 RepID=A0A5C3FAL3_9BASI|nr:uncharacterized protein PSFLO_06219 [Pseudozyma flocculosa]